jgi:transcriptional regulator with XRE-family HTH domain
MENGKLGARIRAFRERKGLSRAELAERSGQDEHFVTAVEDENLYPSLGPLLKLSRALGERLGTFLDDEQGQDPCVVRATERSQDILMHRARGTDASLRFHSLGRAKTDRRMEPFFIEIFPEEEGGLSSHEGEEFIVAVSGRVAVAHGRETHELEPGDSIYFNSVVPHHVGCAPGCERAEIYAVLYFPR